MLYMDKIIELIKYGFYGVITTVFNLVMFYVIIKLGINYICSNVISYFLAVILSYYFNNKYVFINSGKGNNKIKFLKFTAVRVLSIFVDSALLYVLVSNMKMNMWWSKIFLTISIIIATYIINKIFVFKASTDK